MTQLVRFLLETPSVTPRTAQTPLESWGVLDADRVLHVGGLPEFAGVGFLDLLSGWDAYREQVSAGVARAAVVEQPQLLPPCNADGKILCIGLNYRDHAIESGMDIPSEPVVFNKLSGTLCGHQADVSIPSCSQQVDYEAELVIVIGQRAWQCDTETANAAIFGYACGHDVSARDWQLGRPGGQWLLGKSFPGFAPIGPAVVPREDISDPAQLRIQLRINGETLQDSSTSQLIFKPAELICHLTQCMVLNPGDVIFTGTPPGVGMARKPQRFIRAGDVVEVEIEQLGTLSNRFV